MRDLNRQRIRFLTIFVITLVCGIFLASLLSRAPSEPIHDGKALHAWLEEIDGVVFRVTPGKGMRLETTNAAINAITGMGSDAIPWLCQELRTRKPRLQRIVYQLPSRLKTRWLMRKVSSPVNPTLWERHRRAAMGVLILGASAKPLVPELASLLDSGDDCSLYSFALARMGRDGVLPLAKALTNSSTHFNALAALGLTDSSTEAAVPALLYVLTNGGGFPSIQNGFLNARGASKTVIPVLRTATAHTNWVVSQSAVSTLRVLQSEGTGYSQTSYLIRIDRYGNWGTL